MSHDHRSPGEIVMAAAQALIGSVEALGALAARLRVDAERLTLDADVAQALDAAMPPLGLDRHTLASMTPQERQATLGFVRSFLRQAVELAEHPERRPGWFQEDEAVLQSQGRASMAIAGIVASLAPQLGDLDARLKKPGAAFLDVGTGVGWLAVALAETFPELHVTGIDTWRPSLALARRNVAHLAGRITLRDEDVTALEDRDAFDAIFLPGPFLPRRIVPDAVLRARRALRPGGWLLFGVYAAPADALAARLADLRIVRSGGHPWQSAELGALLEESGLSHVRSVERSWQAPIGLFVGSRTP